MCLWIFVNHINDNRLIRLKISRFYVGILIEFHIHLCSSLLWYVISTYGIVKLYIDVSMCEYMNRFLFKPLPVYRH